MINSTEIFDPKYSRRPPANALQGATPAHPVNPPSELYAQPPVSTDQTPEPDNQKTKIDRVVSYIGAVSGAVVLSNEYLIHHDLTHDVATGVLILTLPRMLWGAVRNRRARAELI